MQTNVKIKLPDTVTTSEDITEYKIVIKYSSKDRFIEITQQFRPGVAKLICIEMTRLQYHSYTVLLTEEEFMILKLSFNLVCRQKPLIVNGSLTYYVET